MGLRIRTENCASRLSAIWPFEAKLSCRQKAMSTLVYMVGFGLVALVMHEFFHYVALRALGGDGYITFSLQEGFTHFTTVPDHVWVVRLSGGLLTAVFLLLTFWIWAWSSESPNDTNLEVAAFTWGAGNLAYAPVEILTTSQTVGVLVFGIGFCAAAVLYFVKVTNWVAVYDDSPIKTSTAHVLSTENSPIQSPSLPASSAQSISEKASFS